MLFDSLHKVQTQTQTQPLEAGGSRGGKSFVGAGAGVHKESWSPSVSHPRRWWLGDVQGVQTHPGVPSEALTAVLEKFKNK